MSSVTPPRIGRMMDMDSPRVADVQGEGGDMYDALRDLFLGGQEAHTPDSPALESDTPEAPTHHSEPAWPRIEALVLGHLPVQQSVWVMQYAKDAAAQRGGPVGLLRIREGEATLDLVGSVDSDPMEAPQSMADAVAAISPLIKSLIIRVDPSAEPLLPGLPGVDSITLLTGADEAAIVGSYRTIKGLVGHATDTLPPLRLAIMGSTTERALAAADKIQRAVESHLKESLVVTACLARINAGKSSLVFRGLLTEDVGTMLGRLPGLLRPEPASRRGPSLATAKIEPVVSSRLGFAASSRLESSPPYPPPTSPPLTPATPAPVHPASLSSHLAGLSPTPVVCPFHRNIEVAIDAEARVHLVASAATVETAWKVAGELLSTGSWATAHASLLALAVGRSSIGTPPVLHLMLSEAKGASRVAQAGIKPHLLSPVRVEGKTGWFCTELD